LLKEVKSIDRLLSQKSDAALGIAGEHDFLAGLELNVDKVGTRLQVVEGLEDLPPIALL